MVALRKPWAMTVDEFLRWDSGDSLRYHLIDGEPVAMAPASLTHGLIQSELGRLIGNHLRATGKDCDVIANGGVVPQFLPGHNVRIPDLLVTCETVRPGRQLAQAPVLLVEILSPGNTAETWETVRACMSIPSVREILVLRSDRVEAQVLRRGVDGAWPVAPERALEEVQLACIDMRLSLAELYARSGLVA